MRTIFTTDEVAPKLAFGLWREKLREHLGPLKQSLIADVKFESRIEVAEFGNQALIRTSESCVRTEVPVGMPRRSEGGDTVFASIQLAGHSGCVTDGREAVQRAGEIVLLAERPAIIQSGVGSQKLVVRMSAETLERLLGPTIQYTALTLDAGDATTALTTTFFKELIRVHEGLTAEAAVRMLGIGNDLIIASIAARIARDAPKSLHGNLVVQRSKFYIEANLGSDSLSPHKVAIATGVSTRRLQELYHERGQHVSDWIWERRLTVAAERLANKQFSHIPISTIAFNCGFKTISHFSRRFKSRFGVAPLEYSQRNK